MINLSSEEKEKDAKSAASTACRLGTSSRIYVVPSRAFSMFSRKISPSISLGPADAPIHDDNDENDDDDGVDDDKDDYENNISASDDDDDDGINDNDYEVDDDDDVDDNGINHDDDDIDDDKINDDDDDDNSNDDNADDVLTPVSRKKERADTPPPLPLYSPCAMQPCVSIDAIVRASLLLSRLFFRLRGTRPSHVFLRPSSGLPQAFIRSSSGHSRVFLRLS